MELKDLTYKKWEDAPNVIKHLYVLASAKIPVGTKMITEAYEKHPEYFKKTNTKRVSKSNKGSETN